jgi:hypothetical protein
MEKNEIKLGSGQKKQLVITVSSNLDVGHCYNLTLMDLGNYY